MSKKIKMVLYGEPGTGKSVFASKAPNPLFICSDGNYAWLEDFGADPNAHIDVSSWAETKNIFKNKELLDKYDTIVVDLLEDLFKWCEQEFCIKNKIEHIGDLPFGKGYELSRNEFFIEISKLIAMDKNIILIMHGLHEVVKDRRGVEHTRYIPTNRLPDKVLDMIEGRVRYFLRCYMKAEETSEGTLIKKRLLSIIPKENEFGICRGIDENKVPTDIPLEWSEFTSVIGFTNEPTKKVEIKTTAEIKGEVLTKTEAPVKIEEEKKVEVSEANPLPFDEPVQNPELTPVEEEPSVLPDGNIEKKEEIKQEPPKEEPKKELTNQEKLEAIKAKLAAIKAAKQ